MDFFNPQKLFFKKPLENLYQNGQPMSLWKVAQRNGFDGGLSALISKFTLPVRKISFNYCISPTENGRGVGNALSGFTRQNIANVIPLFKKNLTACTGAGWSRYTLRLSMDRTHVSVLSSVKSAALSICCLSNLFSVIDGYFSLAGLSGIIEVI